MFLYSHWCSLSLPTRHQIAREFGIEKKGATEVFSNTIKSDGYLITDIENALNVEALQLYLGMMEEKDLSVLWNRLIMRIEGKEVEIETPKSPAITVLPPDEVKQFNKEFKARKKNAKAKK